MNLPGLFPAFALGDQPSVVGGTTACHHLSAMPQGRSAPSRLLTGFPLLQMCLRRVVFAGGVIATTAANTCR